MPEQVVEALLGQESEFVRTPKSGELEDKKHKAVMQLSQASVSKESVPKYQKKRWPRNHWYQKNCIKR